MNRTANDPEEKAVERNIPDDIIEGPGFRMERHGRFISIQTNRTPDEQRELMTRFKEVSHKLPEDIKAKADKLEEELSKYNSLDIIAQISLANHVFNPDTYKEYLHKGRAAHAEYVALLCLKKPFSIGQEIMIGGQEIESIQQQAEDIFINTMWLTISKSADPSREGPPGDLEKLQFMIRSNELMVRNPAYTHHLYEVLEGLFTAFEDCLLSEAGYTASDAIRLSRSFVTLVFEKLGERLRRVKTEHDQLRGYVREFRKAGSVPEEGPYQDLVPDLAQFSERELKKRLKNLATAWTFLGLGQSYSYTASELSTHSGVPEERVMRFLESLCLRFGDIEPSFCIPQPDHPLKQRPLIEHENRYMCPSPMLLDWAIQSALERALKSAPDHTWHKYEKHRHDYLLNRSVELMKSIMPESSFHLNLEYDREERDTSKICELDGLGVYDSVLFLIEAKAGGITQAARRGAPERLRKHLGELLGEAHYQATRARTYVASRESPKFRSRNDGSILELNKANNQNVFMVSLTLEPLGHLTSAIHGKTDLTVFEEGDLPWMVNIYDLMVIADCIDHPSMFPHYVKRRVRAANQGFFEAHDELDLFSY